MKPSLQNFTQRIVAIIRMLTGVSEPTLIPVPIPDLCRNNVRTTPSRSLRSLSSYITVSFAAILSLGLGQKGQAQVSNYVFAATTGTYVSQQSGGNPIYASGWDDNTIANAITLPFNFTFNGTSFSTIRVSTNGYITFGTTVPSQTGYTAISATTGYSGAIAALSKDLADQNGGANAIVSNTTGTTPNRKFYIEWIGARAYNGNTALTASASFQIVLNETSNIIEINYGSVTPGNTAWNPLPQVGLRGTSNADFKNLTGTNWTAPTAGTTNSSAMTMSSTNSPASGQTYIFAPPLTLTASNLTAFGSICVGSSGGPNSFTINGYGLSTANITVGALANYTYSTNSGGTYTNSLSLTQAGGIYSQQIFVKFTPPSAAASSGNIAVGGGGASSINVAASGTGVAAAVGGSVAGAATVCSGTNSTTLTLSGQTGSVTRWESSLDNFATAGTTIANTTTTLTATNLTATTSYRAVLTNGTCTANSSSATVTVNPASVGGTVAGAATVCTGTNSTILTLSGHTGSITRWESSLNNFATAGTAIANTTTSLTVSNLTATTSYRAVLTSGVCASANSASATITVSPASVGGSVAGGATVCSGTNSTTLTLSGQTGSVTRWESSLDNFATAGTTIANTTTSLTATNLTATTSYRAVLTSGVCASANSSSATVTVNVVAGGSVAGATAVCTGTNSTTLTLSGHNGSVTRWESSLDNFATAGTTIANTTTSLTASNLTATTSYRAVLTNGACTANSAAATVTVNPASVGGTVAGATTVCTGTNSTTLTLSGQTGSVTRWESSLDNFATAGTTIANTTSSLTVTNITATTSYRAVVTSGACVSANSASATLTVSPASVGGTVAGAATVCTGTNSTTLTLSGHTGSITRWESSLNNFTTAGTAIANTTTSLTVSNLTATTSYRAVLTSGLCASANSASATVTVNPVSVGGTVAGATTVCTGTNSTTLTLSGQTGLVTRWESSLDNFATAGTTIVNTSTTFTASNLTATTSYRAVLTSGVCASANSASATVTVSPVSVGGSVSGGATVCSGTNSTTLTLSGQTGSVTRWESSLDNFATAGTTIANTTTTLTATNLTVTTSYRAVLGTGTCAANSGSVTVTVNPASVGGTVAGATTVCTGTNSTTLTLSGQTGSVIRWESSLNNFATAGTAIANTTTTLTANNLTATTSYRAVLTSGVCASANSASSTVTVTSPITALSYSANPVSYCANIAIATNSPSNTGGAVISYSVSPALPAGLSLNTTTGAITGTPTAITAAANYTVTATNTCGSSQVVINIAVPPVPAALTTTPGARCGTGTVPLAATINSCFSSTISWFAASTGGSSLGTGTSFATPSITTTTNYFAQENLITGETTIPSGSASATTSRGPQFDLYEPVLLTSVDVDNTSGGGSITVGLRDNGGVAVNGVSDVAFTINGSGTNNGVTTIPLNWSIPTGTGYRLLLITNAANQNLQRNSTGYSYPKNLGVGVITNNIDANGTNASPTFNSARYNYFYNWNIGRARVSATAAINPNLPASVSVSASGTTICLGTSVTFSATPTNGGTAPTYQWRKGGVNISGETGAAYTTTTLANNDVITVVMTSNASPCLTGSPATSGAITMTVNPNLPASVSISASATAICAGTSVTFSATPTNGGTAPTYQWRKGGVNISGETGAAYTTTTLANNDVITVVMTSNASPCLTGSPATSGAITMTVNPNLPASVSISASATAICAGTSVTFTATPTNGGTAPTYQWRKGGVNISGATGATYTTTTLANNDVISVVMTSNASPCLTGSPATSTGITITVNPNLPASVSIAASATSICAGTSVTFTATPTNGGTAPTYQWRKGGVNISGATGATYTTTTLANNDVISGVMTSNASPCLTGSPATSTGVTITVNPNLPASVSIAASATSICAGTSVTFTATPTNGGSSPTYQWKKGGVDISGETGSTYTTTTLADNDVITVVMTSNASPCLTGSPAISGAITMTVNPNLPASVSISASATTICAGTSVTFTATPTNGGSSPSYQWKKGGVDISGETGSTYSSTTLADNDVISVEMTSNASPCLTGSPATSGAITMTVNPILPASVSIASTATTICAGTTVTFTATPINGGTTPTYQWRKGGVNISGATGAAYTSTTLADNDVITVVMTSNASPCLTGSPATSNPITVTVNPSPAITATTNSICTGSSFSVTPVNGVNGIVPTETTYSWPLPSSTGQLIGAGYAAGGGSIISGQLINTSNSPQVATYIVTPVSAAGCEGGTFTVTVTVNPNPIDPTISPENLNICEGESGVLTSSVATGGDTYLWSTGATTQSITVSAAGIYSLLIQNLAGCSSTAEAEVTVSINQWTSTGAGAQDRNWNNPANWSCGFIPPSGASAIISNIASVFPQLPTAVNPVVNNLTISAGTLEIQDQTLTINGAITGTGTLTGSNTSSLIIGGSALNQQLKFTPGGTDNFLKNLTINNGATVTLGNALNITSYDGVSTAGTGEGVVTVAGTGVLNTGGNLTIKSGPSGTARIAANTTHTGYISGNVTVERFIPANASRQWRTLSIPTISSQSIKAAWQEGQTALTLGTANLGTQITGSYTNTATAQGLGFDEYTPGTSMLKYDAVNNGLVGVPNTTDPISTEKAYFLYVRGDRSKGKSSATSDFNQTTLRTNGAIKAGDQPTTVLADKSAFIGNPYASPIDLTQIGIAGGSVGTTFSVWDPKLGASLGAYQKLTKDLNGDYIISPGGGSYGAVGTVQNTIQTGLAFFANAVGLDGTITITENSKASGTINAFRPATPAGTEQRFFANLNLTATTGNKVLDGVYVSLDDNHNNSIDNFDSRKQNNFGENISMRKAGINLSVEKRKPFTSDDTLFFNMGSIRKTTYQLYFKTLNLDANLVATLEDKYLNTKTLVNSNGTSTYDFTVDANAASSASDRFRVVFKEIGAGTLPVTFVSIKAAQQNNNIAVEWKVGSQLNVAGYDVERSTDGRSFTKMATIAASATDTYNWLDVNAPQGTSFYRIKATDLSGEFRYTTVVRVNLSKSGATITASPNPVTGNNFTLQFTNQPAGQYKVSLFSASGQLMYSNNIQHNGGSLTQSINLKNSVVSGVYELQVAQPGKAIHNQKLIVDRK